MMCDQYLMNPTEGSIIEKHMLRILDKLFTNGVGFVNLFSVVHKLNL